MIIIIIIIIIIITIIKIIIKIIKKIKSAIKLYSNEDSTTRLVRAFEENAAHQGHQLLVKEARMFAEELGFTLDLSFPHPKCRDNTDGADVPGDQEAPQKGCNGATEN